MSNMRRIQGVYTDPARDPALILVEALDLDQISGRGTFHLKALLGQKDSQRTESSCQSPSCLFSLASIQKTKQYLI